MAMTSTPEWEWNQWYSATHNGTEELEIESSDDSSDEDVIDDWDSMDDPESY